MNKPCRTTVEQWQQYLFIFVDNDVSSLKNVKKEGKVDNNANPLKKRKIQNLMISSLVSALDRSKTADRMAPYILEETAKSLGHNPAELNISRSSVKRYRERYRKQKWRELQEIFKCITQCVIHWDGKLLTPHGFKKMVDRLPVLVTPISTEETHLLDVPKLLSGTGRQQATAAQALIQEWDRREDVIGFCVDTTAVNTGRHNGACILLER